MEGSIGGLDELAEKVKQYKLKQMIGADDCSILIWRKLPHERPRDGSYVLLKYRDATGEIGSTEAAYENGKFWYFYPDGSDGEVNDEVILGWDYLPYQENLPQWTDEETELLRELFNQFLGLE